MPTDTTIQFKQLGKNLKIHTINFDGIRWILNVLTRTKLYIVLTFAYDFLIHAQFANLEKKSINIVYENCYIKTHVIEETV